MGGFTGNPSGIRKVLIVLLVLFLAGGLGWCSTRAHADELPDKGLAIGLGQAARGGEFCFDALSVSQELADGRWLAHLTTHGDGTCDGEPVQANIMVGIVRTTRIGHWAIGFGAGFAEHGDTIVGPVSVLNSPEPRLADRPQLCANILVRRYLFKDRAVLDLTHCSTGGSTYFNAGLNSITLGARIGGKRK